MGEDEPGARFAGGDRLPGPGRPHAVPREAGVRAGRLRLHHVHRELGSAARRGRRRGGRRRSERRRRPVGQPELRGPDPSAGARELPGLAAALRRVRAGGPRRRRPDHRADRRRRRRTRLPRATSGRAPRRSPRPSARRRIAAQFETEYGRIWDGDEHWARAALARPDRCTRGIRTSTYVQEPPFFDRLDDARRSAGTSRARASW